MQTATDERLAGTRQRNTHETAEEYASYVRREQNKIDDKADLFSQLIELVRTSGVTMPDVYAYDFSPTIAATWECRDAQAFRAVLRALGSTIDNPWRKHSTNGSYRMTRSIDGIDLTVRAIWVTCEQVQTGTRVEETTEVVEPAKTRKVVNEVPVYEWRCPDSALLSELADGQTVDPAEIGAG